MYYRQKILLALIEVFGGKLKNTDIQKLLLIFCQQSRQKYYDFFPYKYGGFSLSAFQDKKRLIDQGYLTEDDFIQLSNRSSFFDQLEPCDRILLKTLSTSIGTLRGNALIHETYLEYPQYTCQSTILEKVLNHDEIEKVRSRWTVDYSPCLFTLGYEGITIDAYLSKLIFNNIKILIDVRKNPFSYKKGFSKSQLQKYTGNIGIVYYHFPDLGIPSDLRKKLNSIEDYDNLFQHYQNEILPKQSESLKKIKSLLSEYNRLALTCFEADYHLCHRHKITDYLKQEKDFNIRIQHL